MASIIKKVQSFFSGLGTSIATGGKSTSSTGSTSFGLGSRGATSTSAGTGGVLSVGGSSGGGGTTTPAPSSAPTPAPTRKSGGGGGSVVTQSQQIQQIQQLQSQGLSEQQAIQRAGYTPQQLQASVQQQTRQDFSGQVQVRSPSQKIGGGQLEETQYFVKGKEVGKVRGSSAEVSQPAKLTFKTPTRTEQVKLERQGITQQVTLTPQDVSNVIATESQSIINNPRVYQASTNPVWNPKIFRDIQYSEGGIAISNIYRGLTGNIRSAGKSVIGSVSSNYKGFSPGTQEIINYVQTKTTIPQAWKEFNEFGIGSDPNINLKAGYPLPIFPAGSGSSTYVKFLGTSQKVENNQILTKVAFQSTKTGLLFDRVEVGVAKGITQFNKINEVNYATTISRGKVSGGRQFASLESSVYRQGGKDVLAVGYGKSVPDITKDTKLLYSSLSYGRRVGDYSFGLGVSKSRLGKTYGLGFLKETPDPLRYYSLVGGGRGVVSPRQFALTQVQSSVQSAQTTSNIPRVFTRTSPTTSLITTPTSPTSLEVPTQKVYSSSTTTITSTNQGQTQLSFLKINQIQTPRTRSSSRQIISLGSVQKEIQKQINIQSTSQQQKVAPSQILGQRQLQQQRQQTRVLSVSKTRGIIPFVRVNLSPRTQPRGLLLPKGKSSLSPFGKIKLFVKEKGIFQFKGLFPSVSKASEAGRYITGKSISRSYKIPNVKAPLLSGYRYSKKKGSEDVFVELSKTALSQFGEQKVVKSARRSKTTTRRKRK